MYIDKGQKYHFDGNNQLNLITLGLILKNSLFLNLTCLLLTVGHLMEPKNCLYIWCVISIVMGQSVKVLPCSVRTSKKCSWIEGWILLDDILPNTLGAKVPTKTKTAIKWSSYILSILILILQKILTKKRYIFLTLTNAG